MFEYRGAIHVHTTYSDGSLPAEGVISEARAAGLDFLVITDHDTLDARRRPGEGYYDGLLVLVGCEISPDHNHYLTLGVSEPPSKSLSPRDYIQAARGAGGVGFAAHPHDRGSQILGLPDYAWTATDCQDWDGLELWNFVSSWVGGASNIWRLLLGLIDPGRTGGSPDPETMALWDEVTARRRCPAIGGVDAHGHDSILGRLPLAPFNYRCGFQTVQNRVMLDHPLTGAAEKDIPRVIRALAEGSNYICNAALGDPLGFFFSAASGEPSSNHVWTIGQEASGLDHLTLKVSCPGAGRVRLIRQGTEVASSGGTELVLEAGPGVYRAEAWKRTWSGWRVWVISNPIYFSHGVKK